MSKKNVSLKSLLKRAELLEPRTVLSGTAVVQPFANVANETGAARDWSLQAIEVDEVWDQGYTGENIVIAVIDTGADIFHEDLAHSIWVNEGEIPGNDIDDDNNGFIDDVHGWDFVEFDNEVSDHSGHGTAVSGAVVGARNSFGSTGVAYGASVMVIRTLDANGVGTQLDIAAGIRYAIANGADIINLSLGGTDSKRISTAIQYARTEDVLVVAAAGNASGDEPDYPARYSGEFDNVISVGAYDRNFELTDFSNIVGDTNAIQIDGPGQSIYSTVPDDGYQRVSGTSFAAPYVSGVAALALSANPDLTASELRNLLIEGASHDIGYSDSLGGLNAATTVALATAALPQPVVNPPVVETQKDPVDDSSNGDEDREPTNEQPNSEQTENESTLPEELDDESQATTPVDSETVGSETIDEALAEETPTPNEQPAEGEAPATEEAIEATSDDAASLLEYLGDIDRDGEVGFNDFLTVSRNFGELVDPGAKGDLDRDGEVGFNDFLTFSRNFGRTLDDMYAEEPADMLAESAVEELFDQE